MHVGDKDSLLSKIKKRRAQWIPQLINGIISITMGLTTLQLKRPHEYIDGGIHYYDSGYPYEPPIINQVLPIQLSFLTVSSPALSAILVTILNSQYLFKMRFNKEIKVWVKILIIFLNVAWLIFAIAIPRSILPSIKHPLYKNVDWGPSYYGVYGKIKEKKN